MASFIKILYHQWFKIYHCIVLKLATIYKGIVCVCLSILISLCANCAYADRDVSYTKTELKKLITNFEKQNNIPAGLLFAIAKVESNLKPFALNINGNAVLEVNKEKAVTLIKGALEEGITNIDVGVMQLNIKWHQENFKSIEEMLDPKKNIEYAANFLCKLYKRHGDWHQAVRFYHSATAMHHRRYSRKVTFAWIEIINRVNSYE